VLSNNQLIQELESLEGRIKKLREEISAKTKVRQTEMKEKREAAVQRILGSETDFNSWETEKKTIIKKRIGDIY